MIEGVVYRVCSPEEERALLAQWRASLEAEAAKVEASRASTKEEVRKARIRVVKATRRIERMGGREEQWLERLRREDDEILVAFLN